MAPSLVASNPVGSQSPRELASCSTTISKGWRIRNAGTPSGNAWALRGLKFCLDKECNDVVSGSPFDSGNSPDWALPSSIFDDETDPDFGNFWKNFDGPELGKAYVGLVLDEPSCVEAIDLRPDNEVYSVDSVYVEFWSGEGDVNGEGGEWLIYAALIDLPGTEETEYKYTMLSLPYNAFSQGGSMADDLADMEVASAAENKCLLLLLAGLVVVLLQEV